MRTAAEGILYFLAIVLASYAVWEKLPEGKSTARNLAFAGALLTLFLTFFLTSLAVDEMAKDIADLRNRIKVNDQMAALARETSSPGKAAYSMVTDLLRQFSRLPGETGEITLNNWEGIDLLSRILTKESESHPEELRIIAISIDSGEFEKPAASSSYEYEKAISTVADHGQVERIYLLGEKEWQDVKQHTSWFTSPNSWEIPQHLREIGLGPIGEHQRERVRCYLASQSTLPQGNKSDYDLIVMWRTLQNKTEQFVFGANRRSDGNISIVFGDEADNGAWRQMCFRLRDSPGVISIPEYSSQPVQSR